MRSRYSAYATAQADYIIATTHRDNPQWQEEHLRWKAEILAFCRETEFRGLTLLTYRQGSSEAIVHFIAELSGGAMEECSHFLLEERWLYHRPLPLDTCPARVLSAGID
jgi:SEC-C motif-containing protein